MLKSRMLKLVLVGIVVLMVSLVAVPAVLGQGFDLPVQPVQSNETNETNDIANDIPDDIQPIGVSNNAVIPSSTNNTSNYINTNLPKTGVTDVYFVAILVTVCAIAAVYAYKKVSDYKGIK